MLQALLAGVASIKAQQTRMNVIGNNLANVNTAAYKGGRVTFQDMLAQTIRGASRPTDKNGGTNAIQYGLGVLIAGTDVNNEQGSLNATNRPTDLAIQGNGYFLVSNGDRAAFTRDGGFDLDANGDLVHRATGERVLGWNFITQGNSSTGAVVTPQSSVNVPLGRLNASRVTSFVEYQGNLSGDAPAGLPAGDPQNWTTTMRVFDSLGGSHNVTVEFFNRTDLPGPAPAPISSYEFRVLDDLGNVLTTSGPPLEFDSNGRMTNPGDPTDPTTQRVVTVQVPAGTGGALDFDVTLNFDRIRQLKTDSQVSASNQDGFPPGELQGFSISQDGVIVGLFTNGLTQELGQIALSIFPNPGGLERMGNNLWRATDNSGVGVIGGAKTGGRGAINSGYLEQSNVDIGAEFTDLIVTQRGFQANTRVVSTVDEMLQDLINMKR